MRLIDADALIESICWDECERKHEDCDYTCSSIAPIVNAPTVGGWISVKDGMPQDETEVVILVQHRIGWYRAFAWHDEFGWHSSAEEFVDGESDYVTYWMPLPEPPKEVTGDAAEG